MAGIPKPQYCGQNWLDMKPTQDGRLCGECHKIVVDFTNMTWKEIERIKMEKPTCGLYTPKQLDHWGHEIPPGACSRFTAATVTGGNPEIGITPLGYATVRLKGTTLATHCNERGNYRLDLGNSLDTLKSPTLVFALLGFEALELEVPHTQKGEVQQHAQLAWSEMQLIDFSVTARKQPWIKRVWWRWFRRNR